MPSRLPILGLVGAGVLLLVVLFGLGSMFENLDASHLMWVQYPGSGKLEMFVEPGWKWQGWGKVTKYERRAQFWFVKATDDKAPDRSMRVRFNDGGHAMISGSFAWEAPLDREKFLMLHKKYGSQEAVENQLIRTAAEKSLYMTGPLMSSKESYAERRNDLLSLIEDQLLHGVYKTRTLQVKQPDQITGQDKTVSVVEIQRGTDGNFLRQEESPLQEFGIRAFNLSLNEVDYDSIVEKQIAAQQEMQMAVQTAIVEARTAEQRRMTTEQSGMADAARAKWAQEVEKATEVTAAEKRLAVAELDARTAEQRKRESILIGEGEAEKRRLIMNADGALSIKVDAWLSAQKVYADAIKGYQGNWMPQVITGGGGQAGVAGAGAMQLMEFFAVKAARDLALDMAVPAGKR